MSDPLVIVLQEDEEIINLLQHELERFDPHVARYVLFTTNPFLAQQGSPVVRAILSCNKLERGYHSALHLAALCKKENDYLTFITWSELEVRHPKRTEYIDAHIGRSETTAGIEIPAIAEIVSELVYGFSLEEICATHPNTIMALQQREHAFC